MILTADLAGNVDVGLVGIEPAGKSVMLKRENVCAEGGNVVEKSGKGAGLVQQGNGEAEPAVARNQSLLYYTLNEAYVNIAA